MIDEDWPIAPGTGIYALSKAVGLAISKTFAEHYGITVVVHLYHNIGLLPRPVEPGEGVTPLAVTFADAARAIDASLRLPLTAYPSRFEDIRPVSVEN